jgi:hypothetical protein
MNDFEKTTIAFAVAILTPRQKEILQRVRDGEDLIKEGRTAYIGYEATSSQTVNALLRVCAISLDGFSKLGGPERYVINGTGKEILRQLENK